MSSMKSTTRSKRALSTLLKTLVLTAAGLSAMAANAALIFDSLSGQHNYNQCFTCVANPTIQELGDVITFGGSDRALTDVTIGMAQQTFTGSTPYLVDVTVSLYTINGALNTSLIAARTQTLQIPSTGLFNVSYDFTGVTVPNQIYYGVSFSSAAANADGLRLTLWDYWSPVSPYLGDGQALPVGTDPGTVVSGPNSVSSLVYGRLASNPSQLVSSASNGLGNNQLSNGFTPSVSFTATAVPEPESYALFAAGLLAIGAVARRRLG